MAFFAKLLGIYLRSGIRGSYRLTMMLGRRFKRFQSFPIETGNGTLFADLRIASSHGILAWSTGRSGEARVMQDLVGEGDIVYDIGAHFGLYTLLLSGSVGETGKVYAFEPNPELLPSLIISVERLRNVKLFPVALSDTEGTVDLFVPEDASMASLNDWTKGVGGNVHKVACEKVRLDELIKKENIPYAHFIKCDVEGAELAVFLGAREMLDRSDAPIMLFEVNRKAAEAFGNKPSSYFDFLTSLEAARFVFFEVLMEGIKPLESVAIEYANILAVPEAKLDRCKRLLK